MNKCMFIARFTKDPELKYLDSGVAVVNATIACNSQYKDKDGNKKENVLFLPITVWGKQAEIIAEFCNKGDKIYLEGELRQKQRTTEDGKQYNEMYLNINNFELLTSKNKEQEQTVKENNDKKTTKKTQPKKKTTEDENFLVD